MLGEWFVSCLARIQLKLYAKRRCVRLGKPAFEPKSNPIRTHWKKGPVCWNVFTNGYIAGYSLPVCWCSSRERRCEQAGKKSETRKRLNAMDDDEHEEEEENDVDDDDDGCKCGSKWLWLALLAHPNTDGSHQLVYRKVYARNCFDPPVCTPFAWHSTGTHRQ